MIEDFIQVEAKAGYRFPYLFVNAKIDHGIAKVRPEEEFRRKVRDDLRLPTLGRQGFHPAVEQSVANGTGNCGVPVEPGRVFRFPPLHTAKVLEDGPSDELRVGAEADVLAGPVRDLARDGRLFPFHKVSRQ